MLFFEIIQKVSSDAGWTHSMGAIALCFIMNLAWWLRVN